MVFNPWPGGVHDWPYFVTGSCCHHVQFCNCSQLLTPLAVYSMCAFLVSHTQWWRQSLGHSFSYSVKMMVGQGPGSLSHLKLVKGLCLTRLAWRVTCRTIVPNGPMSDILHLNKGLWGINSWRKQQPSRVPISQILTWIAHVSDLVPQEAIQWIHEFFCKLLFFLSTAKLSLF